MAIVRLVPDVVRRLVTNQENLVVAPELPGRELWESAKVSALAPESGKCQSVGPGTGIRAPDDIWREYPKGVRELAEECTCSTVAGQPTDDFRDGYVVGSSAGGPGQVRSRGSQESVYLLVGP